MMNCVENADFSAFFTPTYATMNCVQKILDVLILVLYLPQKTEMYHYFSKAAPKNQSLNNDGQKNLPKIKKINISLIQHQTKVWSTDD